MPRHPATACGLPTPRTPHLSRPTAPTGATCTSRSDTPGDMRIAHQCSPCPPHPPSMKAAPQIGKAGKQGGAQIVFFLSGIRGQLQKPVDCTLCNYVPPRGCKRGGEFAKLKNPRFGLFLPRFGPFLPHAALVGFARHYLSIYLFREREEGIEGLECRRGVSTDLKSGQNLYPQKFMCIHGFLWMGKRAETQCWRGFAGFLTLIHTSTAGNALGGAWRATGAGL